MAFGHLLMIFMAVLIFNTASMCKAENAVSVQTGSSIQLDIQTDKPPQFHTLVWMNDKSEIIVTFTKEETPTLKNSVAFNQTTFSLTLKNMQKTDSGLYTAKIFGLSNKDVAKYRVSVIDAVEDPVLTVNSNWSSSDSCTVNFTCRAHDLMIHSSYQNNRCSPEEVTSHENYTLILYCSEESIICNHSNPVSSKKDRIEIKQLCVNNKENITGDDETKPSLQSWPYILVAVCLFLAITIFLVFLYCKCKKGFSAEIPVFVQTGDSVQLDIQTQELPEFNILFWTKDKSENIVVYIHGVKVNPHSSYKNRVYFNDETFSLTLKNMQKTDSGLYTARASGESEKNIVTYRVSVIDAVEAPVLTVNSSWSSSDPCSFTCKGSNIIISSIYNSSSCSPEESSSENYNLRLNCSGDYIMCNYSNPVSWKTDRKKVNELCTVDQEIPQADFQSVLPSWFIFLICLLTTSLLASVIGWCFYKRKKDHSYTPDQQNDLTVYEKVDENIKPQRSLNKLEKSKNTSTVYDTLREHGPPDVQTSPNHDSVDQSATLTEKSQPNAAATIYYTIEKQPKSEADHTIYAVVNTPPDGDESVHPKPK
ncbi:uncharacterized protein LOC127500653 [Ctenopharyngodon idella]|uniref:uncharacterized protein LOC127500653 n=1 Tax=Ctenopharyngodon idella TaxID=7959 RepID=UPI00222EB84A|nr:uncharacterized protein LOC127500653 [Ctenopharyngodon idella]